MRYSYWKLPLDFWSLTFQAFMSPNGIYFSIEVRQGTTIAVTHFQWAHESTVPSCLRDNVLYWPDNVLLHAKTFDCLLKHTHRLFGGLLPSNYMLHHLKAVLFSRSLKGRGFTASKDGIHFDPTRLDCPTNMKALTIWSQLQQFFWATDWARVEIYQFAGLIHSFQACLEQLYSYWKKRTKKGIAIFPLCKAGWLKIEK